MTGSELKATPAASGSIISWTMTAVAAGGQGNPGLLTIGRHGRAEAGFPNIGNALLNVLRPDTQKALELTGEGVLRTILIRRRGAHGEHRLGAVDPEEGGGQLAANWAARNEIRKSGSQGFGIGGGFHGGVLGRGDAVAEGLRCQHEKVRHREAGPKQPQQGTGFAARVAAVA